MSMMTAQQYEESLRRLNLVVYMFGRRLGDRPEEERDVQHPPFRKAGWILGGGLGFTDDQEIEEAKRCLHGELDLRLAEEAKREGAYNRHFYRKTHNHPMLGRLFLDR